MAKEITKYKQILSEARERVEEAGSRVEALEKDLAVAEAVFQSLHKGYLALERSLTPKPRKKQERSAPAQKDPPPADKPASDALCVAQVPGIDVLCGEPEDALIHDPNGGYASYHVFEPPKSSVVRAQRKSRQKKEEPGSDQNSEIVKDAALSVGAGD
jgi:hypothetical protein